MSPRPQLTPIDRLVDAMHCVATVRGTAEFTNGYRVANASTRRLDDDELFAREMKQWVHVGKEVRAFRRLASKLLREAAQAPRKTPKSRRRPSGRTHQRETRVSRG